MMRIPVGKHRSRLEMNMTPMIDVVFLLIIFFLVSSHLAKQEVQAELSLPVAETGEEQQTARRRVTINVVAERNHYVIRFGTRPVKTKNLRKSLQQEWERAGDDLEVRIRSDREIPYGMVEPILVACAQLGIWNVQFAVIQSVDAT
jgi:biopolymer transport protein ExbD